MNLINLIQKASVFLIIIITFSSCSYLPEPYTKDAELIIQENAEYISLTSSATDYTKAGIVFYPGGLVDPNAYTSWLQKLVLEDNRMVIIVKVASNLAIINSQKASKIVSKIDKVNRWVVGGHSLGGSVTCIDAFNNPDSFHALFLLASYSINELSESDLPVISITASNDEVLDLEKFEENKVNLPEEMSVNTPDEIQSGSTSGKTIYYHIEGGNHAQFGNYGNQNGDGIATIDAVTQQTKVIEMLRQFLLSNNL